MISHSKKFIFVHIPKTGGTSVSKMLKKHGIMLQGERNYGSVYFKHAIAADLKRMMGDEWDNYFKFTFVRNPWDWIVSNYEYNRGVHQPFFRGTEYDIIHKDNKPEWAEKMSFSEWLPWWIDAFHPSQLFMLQSEEGELLVDEVFKHERLKDDYKKLRNILGIRDWRSKFPHLESSKGRRDHKSYYDPDSIERVREHFADDIRVLDYPNEP